MKRVATANLASALLLPALLFMGALALRELRALPAVARAGQRIVMAYATHPWTLWVLLLALPAAVVVLGLPSLRSRGRGQAPAPHAARLRVASVAALSILLVVIVHMAAT